MLKLLLPVMIPSWRFFETVEPSPRIDWSVGRSAQWSEVRPRPSRLGWRARVFSLFWNPERNEALFLASLAERLGVDAAQKTVSLMERHIEFALAQADAAPLQFRLRFVDNDFENIRFVSCLWTPR